MSEIPDVIIEAVRTIVNARWHKEYRLMEENHFNMAEVKYILEAANDLNNKLEEALDGSNKE